MSPELLEDMRHLSNIEKEILNIVFVGQGEFNDRLLDGRNRALRQRIGINYHIDPLTEEETKEYIDHRLKTAGSKGSIFSADAIREIFLFSGGILRLINIVSDRALLSGYVKQEKLLRADIIKECADELRLPGEEIELRLPGEEIAIREIEQNALRLSEYVKQEKRLGADIIKECADELRLPGCRTKTKSLRLEKLFALSKFGHTT